MLPTDRDILPSSVVNSVLRIVGITLLALNWVLAGVLGHPTFYSSMAAVGLRSAEADGAGIVPMRWGIEPLGDLPRAGVILNWGSKNVDQHTDGKELPWLSAVAGYSPIFVLLYPENFIPSKPWHLTRQEALHPRAPCRRS